jgi:hypothetical protein
VLGQRYLLLIGLAVETFFWRAGDLLSSVAVFIVVRSLALSVRGFAFVNIAIVVI